MAQVDVIIPTYNRRQVLQRAINSVLTQNYPHWTLWVVDDGSTDDTRDIIDGFQKLDGRVHSLRTTGVGVSGARNLAIENSKAPFIAFLDSDDEWLPDKLKLQMAFMAANPHIPLVHAEEIWIRNGVRVNAMKKHQKQGGRIFADCLPLCCISPSAVLVRREIFCEVQAFREDFVVCEDYELWLRIAARFEVGFLDTPLVKKYGGHEGQLSRRYHSMDYFRVKAMMPFLNSDHLSDQEEAAVRRVLGEKIPILLRGYRKHGNLSNFDEVFALWKSYEAACDLAEARGNLTTNSVFRASEL